MIPLVLILTSCNLDGPATDAGKSPVPSSPLTDASEPTDDDDDDDAPGRPSCTPAAGLVINEASASNVSLLFDEQGDSVDWVELYNPDPVPVSLAGWTLSDNTDEPGKWEFPALTLDPGAFLLVYASGTGPSTPVVTWDTRIDQGDLWRYRAVESAPDPDWMIPGYDDGDWETGPSGFGRADADDATEVSSRTVYLRTTVDLTADDLAEITAMFLHVDYDDGFVAYLNGVEVARSGVGVSGVPTTWDLYAKSDHEALVYQGLQPEAFDLASSLGLVSEGPNTLAIEVHNYSETSADLSLTPFLSLGFASQREARTSAVLDLTSIRMHANFSLQADGEQVALYNPTGCEVDDLDPGQMFADESYGRETDGSNVMGYFLEPTPGASNTTECRPGFATTPWFDPVPGYYPGGTDVTLTADPGSTVHVAWEGAEPTEDDPTYAGPLETGSNGDAVVVRARAWQEGLWPSRIATGTYLLYEPGAMPIVSLVTDPPNLWDEQDGMYVLGETWDEAQPHRGANFWEDWEKPVHMEEWEPDGTLGFSVDAGFSVYGGWSRAHEQKSLLVKLNSGYGDPSIEHDVFPGLGITSFNRLLLRAGGTDWQGCFMDGCSEGAHLRDAVMHRLAAGQDVDVMAYRPAELYLNGVYWGIYEMRERPDDDYVLSHHGYEDIDLLEPNGNPIHGDGVEYQATLEYMRTHDMTDPAIYAEVGRMIDLDELSTYLILEIFYDNTDWPANNMKYWHPRVTDGRWRWLLYDTDNGLGRRDGDPNHDSLAAALEAQGEGWPNPPWSTELFRLLVQSPQFTDDFINRYAGFLNTILSSDTTRATLHDMEADLVPAMPRHKARWGVWTDGVTTNTMKPDAWEKEVAWIDEWLTERPAHARDHLVSNFGLAGTWILDIDASPAGSGTLRIGTIDVNGPFTGTWFRGVPVTVTAVPAPGYTFAGWSDSSLPSDPTVTLVPNGPVSLVALFQ